MPTVVAWRDVTPTRLRVAPEPVGLAYALHLPPRAAQQAPAPDAELVGQHGVASTGGDTGGRFAYIDYPDPVDYTALNATGAAALVFDQLDAGQVGVGILNGPFGSGLFPYIEVGPETLWPEGVARFPLDVCGW